MRWLLVDKTCSWAFSHEKQGHRAVVLFAGLHDGFDRFKIAEFVDPEYDRLLKDAKSQGVEAYAYAGKFDISDGIRPHFLSQKGTLHRLKNNWELFAFCYWQVIWE